MVKKNLTLLVGHSAELSEFTITTRMINPETDILPVGLNKLYEQEAKKLIQGFLNFLPFGTIRAMVAEYKKQGLQ